MIFQYLPRLFKKPKKSAEPDRRNTSIINAELKIHYPGLVDVAPSCKDAEWYWLKFLHYSLLQETSIQTRQLLIGSISDPNIGWNTWAIQKEKVDDIRMGSKSYLCLTGEIAGMIAANTTTHVQRLRQYYHLDESQIASFQGILMRPLLIQPYDRKDMEEMKACYKTSDNWYIPSVIELINKLRLPFDEEKFINNTVPTENILIE